MDKHDETRDERSVRVHFGVVRMFVIHVSLFSPCRFFFLECVFFLFFPSPLQVSCVFSHPSRPPDSCGRPGEASGD